MLWRLATNRFCIGWSTELSKNYLFTEKGKKQFNKLSAKDKQAVAEVAIADAVNKALSKHIPEAIIQGRRLSLESLYQKHVQNIDRMATGDKEWVLAVNQLLSDIRLGHVEYEKMMGKSE